MISFVIPAHDEERLIGRALDAVDEAARAVGAPFEIVVVDDGSTDRTGAIARERGARVVRVQHRHIAAARNAGARAARGDVLVFVDADTRAGRDVVAATLGALEAGAVGGGCAVRFDGPLPAWARWMQPVAERAQRVLRFAAGCFVFCRRDAFEAAGGFDETLFAGEELELSRSLRQQGRFVVLRESVETSGRKLRAHSGWTIARTMLRLAVRGRRGVRSRDRLELWYGPRVDDPERPGQ